MYEARKASVVAIVLFGRGLENRPTLHRVFLANEKVVSKKLSTT
jgi:hypothetical protein